MNEPSTDRLQDMIRDAAAKFEYPPTPDVARNVRARLFSAQAKRRPDLRWAVALVLVVVLGLLVATTVPPVRAALLRILQIGAVQVNVDEESIIAPGLTPEPEPVSIADLGEPISMEEADAFLTFRDPAYPPALGRPDVVYGQNLIYREPVISFFWQEQNDRPQIVLTQIEIPNFGVKWAIGDQVLETEVGDHPAVWIEGPHVFDLNNAAVDLDTRLATNVLIWSDGDVTYRLEGEISIEDARFIAESWN
ncbi:MAG: hypothetical protein R3293_00375 [Candidatus Promineifilaceae bacterium]|nr:hypothetical protein [Candidatus Promineifilaceae bacterium]